MVESDNRATTKGTIPAGTKVEVRTVFDRSWTNGFTVDERTPDGYRVRRRSDGRVLPRIFAFDVVRRERHDLWWM